MGGACSEPERIEKKTLVKILTEKNFRSCLLALTKLPCLHSENMVSITGLAGLKKLKTPELFQIYQINTYGDKIIYNYRHYEVNTHKILIDIIDIDPLTFQFPNSYENKTMVLIYGEDEIHF
jgi:hypothetical protein